MNRYSFEDLGLSDKFSPNDLPPLPGLSPRYVAYIARSVANYYQEQTHLNIEHDDHGYLFVSDVYSITVRSEVESAVLLRLTCARFWRRAIEAKENEARINLEAAIGLLGGPGTNTEVYCSNETLERVAEKAAHAEQQLARLKVLNTLTGQETDMLTVAKNNERARFAQLYHTTVSIEKLADEMGHHWVFVTLTAPPEYHPNPVVGKKSYRSDLGVKASHNYINIEWTRIRARLAKKGLKANPQGYFGVRTVEPHKDGCLHWHLLVFMPPSDIATFSDEILKSFPRAHQCKIVVGKMASEGGAKAASYLFKYIAKGYSKEPAILSNTLDKVDETREADDLASFRNKHRVQAALSCLRTRQYQTFGLLKITTLLKLINKLDLADVSASKNSPLSFIKEKVWRNENGFLNLLNSKTVDLGSFNRESGGVFLLRESTVTTYGEPVTRVIGLQIGDIQYLNKTIYKISAR